MRNRFERQLETLNRELITMGSLCEDAIELAVEALFTRDKEASERLRTFDSEIDRKERDIEAICMKLLLQQQPVASDLRHISAALKMITDMERIGDQAEDISDIACCLSGRTVEECSIIRGMAKETIKMVTQSVDAYVKQDTELASGVISHDDIVDKYFCDIKKKLIEIIMVNPDEGEEALDLLMIAKYFERIGDHAVNIAEWVIFSVTGKHGGK